MNWTSELREAEKFSGPGHSKGYPPEKCLRIASIVAGLCVTTSELAFPGLTENLVDEEYRKNYG